MGPARRYRVLKAKENQGDLVKFPSAYKPKSYRSPVFISALITILFTASASAYFNPDFRKWTVSAVSKAYSKVVSFLETDYSSHEAAALMSRGLSVRSKGKLNEASEMFKQAMARYVNNNDKNGIAVSHTEMGILYTATRDHSLARDHLDQALMYFASEDDLNGMAYASINLGKLFFVQNKLKLAAKSYKEAEEYYKENGNSEGLGNISRALGTLSIAQNNYPDALRYFGEAESWYQKKNNDRGLVLTYNALSDLFDKQGNNKVSNQFKERARAIKLNGSSSDLPGFSIRKNFEWLISAFKENQNAYESELNSKAKQETERALR